MTAQTVVPDFTPQGCDQSRPCHWCGRTDRIVLGQVARAGGQVVEALSVDGVWHFAAEWGAWTVEHLPTGRVLTHAGYSLDEACASAAWLLAELDLAAVPV